MEKGKRKIATGERSLQVHAKGLADSANASIALLELTGVDITLPEWPTMAHRSDRGALRILPWSLRAM